jgi:Glycosyltransferase family 87
MEAAIERLDDRLPASRNLKTILWILLLLAAAEFVVRGPVRYLRERSNWNDLSQNYTASKLWLQGKSPSDPRNFSILWKREADSHLDVTDIRTHLAPPLGELVVLAPIAALPWKFAKLLWLTVLLGAFASTVWALTLSAGFRWREDNLRTLAFIAACLALAPFQTGIASGNPSILVIGLCAMAIWVAHRQHDVTAGILFGVACGVKPQIGAFLVLYYLVRQRWKLFATAVATTSGLVVVAVLYLWLRGAAWMQDYLHNAKGFVTANSIDDFSGANPIRFTLINLQVPFFSITGHSSSANLLAFAIGGLLLCAWLYLIARTPTRGNGQGLELLSLGAVAIISLLPVYHRFYDAGLLVVPLCWCMTHIGKRSNRVVPIALFLLVPFLVPGTAFLQQLAAHGKVPDAVTHSWWWNCVVMPHETWALVLLCLVLLYAIKMRQPVHAKA